MIGNERYFDKGILNLTSISLKAVQDKTLSLQAIGFLAKLNNPKIMFNDKYNFLTNAELAHVCNVSHSTVRKYLRILHEKKYIRIEYATQFGKGRKIYLE